MYYGSIKQHERNIVLAVFNIHKSSIILQIYITKEEGNYSGSSFIMSYIYLSCSWRGLTDSMEDDHSQVIEELKTAIQYNDSEALKDTLSCYPEAVGGLVIDGVPLLHYICKQPVSCVDILKVVLEARGADVNQTSDEVGGEMKTSIEPFNGCFPKKTGESLGEKQFRSDCI